MLDGYPWLDYLPSAFALCICDVRMRTGCPLIKFEKFSMRAYM